MKFGFFSSKNNENNFYYQPILYLAHFKNYLDDIQNMMEHVAVRKACTLFKIRVGTAPS
jgi:hypothetical protein